MHADQVSGRLSSVDNALKLLKLLGAHHSLRVSEAATELGIAPSSAHRLLRTLRDNGFAMQDRANGAYRVGPELSEIGMAAIRGLDVRRLARPLVEELRELTGETISLSVLEGRDVRFVDGLEGTRSVRVGDRTGRVVPATCAATGKAILAGMSPADLEARFPDHTLVTLTESSVAGWEELLADLAQVRSRGVAVNRDETENGVGAVAVALHGIHDTALAAVAIIVPSSRFDSAREAELAAVLSGAVAARGFAG